MTNIYMYILYIYVHVCVDRLRIRRIGVQVILESS